MPDVVTVDQIRDLIKSENIRPSDLFPMERLVADPAVKGYAEDKVRERIGSEYQHRKDAEEKLERFQKEFSPKEQALQAEIKALKLDAAKARLGSLLDKQKVERKLDDRQLKFVQNRISRFTPQNPDELDKEFSSFLDGEVDEYKRIAKDVFGIEDKPADGDDKGKPTGAEPVPTGKKPASPENKYVDPRTNPFIRV